MVSFLGDVAWTSPVSPRTPSGCWHEVGKFYGAYLSLLPDLKLCTFILIKSSLEDFISNPPHLPPSPLPCTHTPVVRAYIRLTGSTARAWTGLFLKLCLAIKELRANPTWTRKLPEQRSAILDHPVSSQTAHTACWSHQHRVSYLQFKTVWLCPDVQKKYVVCRGRNSLNRPPPPHPPVCPEKKKMFSRNRPEAAVL